MKILGQEGSSGVIEFFIIVAYDGEHHLVLVEIEGLCDAQEDFHNDASDLFCDAQRMLASRRGKLKWKSHVTHNN